MKKIMALVVGAASAVFAAPSKDLQDVLDRMEKAEKDVKTMTFYFVQSALVKVTGEKQDIQGKAFFQRPAKFRVEHQLPEAQTVVSDGEKLWYYNRTRNQVFVDKWDNWTASSGFPKGLTPFQTDVAGFKKKYAISLEKNIGTKSGGGTAVLKLVPSEESPWPYVFKLWIDMKTGFPTRTELESQSMKVTTLVNQLQVNPVVSTGTFTFQAPPGAEVMGGAP